MVHLVLHPHGIGPIFLKLDSCLPGAGFIPIISTKGMIQIKKNIVRKKFSFMHTKRYNKFFKKWVQYRVGAISRVYYLIIMSASCLMNTLHVHCQISLTTEMFLAYST